LCLCYYYISFLRTWRLVSTLIWASAFRFDLQCSTLHDASHSYFRDSRGRRGRHASRHQHEADYMSSISDYLKSELMIIGFQSSHLHTFRTRSADHSPSLDSLAWSIHGWTLGDIKIFELRRDNTLFLLVSSHSTHTETLPVSPWFRESRWILDAFADDDPISEAEKKEISVWFTLSSIASITSMWGLLKICPFCLTYKARCLDVPSSHYPFLITTTAPTSWAPESHLGFGT